MTSNRFLGWGAGLVIVAMLLVVAVPPIRHTVFGTAYRLFRPEPAFDPRVDIRGPSGWGGMSSSTVSGDDIAGKGRLTPGIDFGSFSAAKAVFIWGDFSGGGGGSVETDKDKLECSGWVLNSVDGRRVQFTGETRDGKSGRVTVEGREYDLAAGGLFLVSARRGYRVLQLKRDLARFQDAQQLFSELRKSDPEVVEFFARAVAVSANGRWIALGKGHALSVLEGETGQVVTKNDGHTDDITALAFSPDMRLLASGGKDNLVILWTIPGGDITRKLPVPSPVIHVAFSGDGKTLSVREDTSPNTITDRCLDAISGEQVGGISQSSITPSPPETDSR